MMSGLRFPLRSVLAVLLCAGLVACGGSAPGPGGDKAEAAAPLVSEPEGAVVATINGEAIGEAMLARVARNRGWTWLELDGGLALRIRPQHQARFRALDLDSVSGRTVEARGWVLERMRPGPGQARWLLELDHPVLLRPVERVGM